MIPYGRHNITQKDIDVVVEVLRSDYLTQGPVLPKFEKIVARYCGARYAVATNSATSALHIACLALKVGKGDTVWTTPITFVASANCALYCGANVDFVDIDSRTYNMSLGCLAEKLVQAEKNGTLPKVVIPVHLCGQSCEMADIKALSSRYGFKIIEDASHAVGGRYRDQPIGNCRYSDISVFSFHPVKIITTGEGGMAITQNEHLARQMQLLRSHGITKNMDEMVPRSKNELWGYQQKVLGFNYRMTDISAALGISQMERLDEFVLTRHNIAGIYENMLSEMPVIAPWQHEDCFSSFHLYPIRLKLNECNKNQRQVYEALHRFGIGASLHYIPVYLQPFYAKLGFQAGYCYEAEQYFAEAISLPIFSELTEFQQHKVINALRSCL